MRDIVIDIDAATVEEYRRMGGRPPEPEDLNYDDRYAEPDDPDREPPDAR